MKKIAVNEQNLSEVLAAIKSEPFPAVDTETTGLRHFHQDRIFSVIVACADDVVYYFNFQDYSKFFTEDTDEFQAHTYKTTGPVLDRRVLQEFPNVLNGKTVFLQNAKFDLGMFYADGVVFDFDVHDTEVGARLLDNDHFKYNLDSLVERAFGEHKEDIIKKYMDARGLYTKQFVAGKKEEQKNYHYDRVPYGMVFSYGCKDGWLTRKLGMYQLERMKLFSEEKNSFGFSFQDLYNNEKILTKKCLLMERRGILIDKEYCEKARQFERDRYQSAQTRFEQDTGTEFVDSGECLGPIFRDLGFNLPKTEDGGDSVDDRVLASITHPLAEVVREYRDAYKRCNTYFTAYLYHADKDGLIHPDMRQAGTKTGRFSYRDPNLQNVTKDEDLANPYPIRRAFVPRPGYMYVMIDYNQMEFRMMLDYAGEIPLIRKIKEGHDPHQATADMTGLSRKHAKTLNFGILYGMGLDKLGAALGVSREEAKKFKKMYFDGLPMVESLIIQATSKAKLNKQVCNWFGRTFQFPDSNFAYRAINSIIQGGCADVVKKAMVGLMEEPLILQVHDELVLEVREDELHMVEKAVQVMESQYPYRYLPLTCSIEHSLKSWGDPVEGLPVGAKAGNDVQGKSG